MNNNTRSAQTCQSILGSLTVELDEIRATPANIALNAKVIPRIFVFAFFLNHSSSDKLLFEVSHQYIFWKCQPPIISIF